MMNTPPTEIPALVAETTGIPRELYDQAMALAVAAEQIPGVSVAIVFHTEPWENSIGAPAILGGNTPTMIGHLLGVVLGWARARGLFDPHGCNCPACIAKRGQPVTVSA